MESIECNKLTKIYHGSKKRALDSVNLSVPTRGIFALIGRNGAGKTTLVRILATQLEATSGSAEINGIDVMRNPEGIRRLIAVVPQEARAISWLTPNQQIFSYLLWRGFGYAEARQRTRKALSELKIGQYADTKSFALSGGTKRKVMVATVIASGAQMLFLDEPTTGLDPIARQELWELLNLLKKKHFIFLTTHYLEEAENLADYIGIMHNGKILAIGSLDQLRKGMGYSHSVRFKGYKKMAGVKGRRVVGKDGYTQMFVNEDNAHRISKKLLASDVSFSMMPTSLDNIFYYYVKSGLDETEEKEDEWG